MIVVVVVFFSANCLHRNRPHPLKISITNEKRPS